MDEISRLLDNGFEVRIFRSALGSYTACARHPTKRSPQKDAWLTDDFEPSSAIKRLAEKVFRTGEYANRETE